MQLSTLTLVHSDDRFCLDCERVTRWTDRAGYARCTYCGREAPSPDRAHGDRPARPSPLTRLRTTARRVRHTLREYPLLLVLLVMLAASVGLATWLDAQPSETATSAPAAEPTVVVETG